MKTYVMCKAGEVGKIVINKCLDRGIFINTQKLEKLLVLMQIECVKRSKKPLFTEEILVTKYGVMIEEVDIGLMDGAVYFNEKKESFILLLEKEDESVECVLELYGHMDAFELNQLPIIQYFIEMSINVCNKRVILLGDIQGKYMFD